VVEIENMPKIREDRMTVGEEIANSVLHGVGAALAIAALAILVVAAAGTASAWHVVSYSIYGASLVLLYLFSTLYHGIRLKGPKDVFEILDHSGVFLLIAGTYTPMALIVLHGTIGWVIFGLEWGMATAGILAKTVFSAYTVKRMNGISTAIYVAMGWTVVIGAKTLLGRMPPGGLALLLAGGILYTAGTFFYLWRAVKFHHALWHAFVIAGSVCHFFCVLWYVTPIKV
jgi:hemolysin III